jgi:hypothetical protein
MPALNQQMFPVFLGLLLAAAVAWIYVSSRLYTELRQNHPGLYRKLGSPRLVMKKSLATNYRVIKFLFRPEQETPLDPALVQLCRGLRSLLYIYLFCLVGSLLLLLDRLA